MTIEKVLEQWGGDITVMVTRAVLNELPLYNVAVYRNNDFRREPDIVITHTSLPRALEIVANRLEAALPKTCTCRA